MVTLVWELKLCKNDCHALEKKHVFFISFYDYNSCKRNL